MEIRPLQAHDQASVLGIMEEHSFQFPPFIREQYPKRWKTHLEVTDDSRSGFYVVVDETLRKRIRGKAGEACDYSRA